MRAASVVVLAAMGATGCIYDTSRPASAERVLGDAAVRDAADAASVDTSMDRVRPVDRALALDKPTPDSPMAPTDTKPTPDTAKPPTDTMPMLDMSKPDTKLSPDTLLQIVTWTNGQASASCSVGVLIGGGGYGCAPAMLVPFNPLKDPPDPPSEFTIGCVNTPAVGTAVAACLNTTLYPGVVSRTKNMSDSADSPPCAAGNLLVGGGCSCSGGIASSYPDLSANKWWCACQAGGLPEAFAVCLTTSSLTISISKNPTCAKGQMIGGGCDCSGNVLSASQPSGNGWSCSCSNPTTYTICATP